MKDSTAIDETAGGDENLRSVDADGFFKLIADGSQSEFQSSFACFETSVDANKKSDGSYRSSGRGDKDGGLEENELLVKTSSESSNAAPDHVKAVDSQTTTDASTEEELVTVKSLGAAASTSNDSDGEDGSAPLQQTLLKFIKTTEERFDAIEKQMTTILLQQKLILEQNGSLIQILCHPSSAPAAKSNVLTPQELSPTSESPSVVVEDVSVSELTQKWSHVRSCMDKRIAVQHDADLGAVITSQPKNMSVTLEDEPFSTTGVSYDYEIKINATSTVGGSSIRHSSSDSQQRRTKSTSLMISSANVIESSESEDISIVSKSNHDNNMPTLRRRSSRRVESSSRDRPSSPRRRSKSRESSVDEDIDVVHPAPPPTPVSSEDMENDRISSVIDHACSENNHDNNMPTPRRRSSRRVESSSRDRPSSPGRLRKSRASSVDEDTDVVLPAPPATPVTSEDMENSRISSAIDHACSENNPDNVGKKTSGVKSPSTQPERRHSRRSSSRESLGHDGIRLRRRGSVRSEAGSDHIRQQRGSSRDVAVRDDVLRQQSLSLTSSNNIIDSANDGNVVISMSSNVAVKKKERKKLKKRTSMTSTSRRTDDHVTTDDDIDDDYE